MPHPDSFTFSIETLGCKANLTDSHALSARLAALGGRAVEESPEVYILNSCTVTDRADRDALSILKKRRAKLRVLTGCLAEVDPQLLERNSVHSDGAVLLARNSAKQDLPNAIVQGLRNPGSAPQLLSGDRSVWHKEVDFAQGSELSAGTRTRAYLKVQDGCNQFCSYCIIPHARGRSRSVSADAVVSEVNAIAAAGVQEVVLTAIHAADYEESGKNFLNLVERVLRDTKIPRLRLTSLDPSEIDSALLDLMASEPRLCAHLHVSLQSANSAVLLAMKRHYDAKRAEECLQEIFRRVPGIFVGMDMIAGFPGETDEAHADTIALLKRTPWTRLHVFPYSVRRSTLASRMVEEGLGVPEHAKRSRAAELRALSAERVGQELAKRVGKLMEVLTEEKPVRIDGEIFTQGHSRSYFKVLLPGEIAPNQLVRAQIQRIHGGRESLVGAIV